jgi:succinate dehydrogenase / fumarate reductase flavoprotein subunit
MYHQFKELAGIDITREPMEVGPTTHYAMGGIRVDADTQMSNLPGLFACGECAGGLHGANRLGGNSLSDLLVFGKRAGEHAARFASEAGEGTLDAGQIEAAARSALDPLERAPAEDDIGPHRLTLAIQAHMQEHAGIVRDRERLMLALEGLRGFGTRAAALATGGNREFNSAWHTALDLRNILTVAEAVVRPALERTESRGAHARVDHPDKDPAWGKVNLVVRKAADGQMEVRREPVKEMRQDLKDIIEEMS